MNLLLTGATGFLGYRTLEKLVDVSDIQHVVATGRNLLPYRKISHPKVSYLLGDLENAAFVNSICQNIDIIINTASLSSPWGKRQNFINANLLTQSNLLDAAKNNRVSRFIYISSPGIYNTGKERFNVKESDVLPHKFINEYSRTKYEAEQLLIKSFSPYIILRPRALIGRGDSIIMPRLIHAFDQGKLKIIGNGQNIVDLTAVSNVADAIILALTAEAPALNEAYNITNGEPVNLWQKIETVLSALNRTMKKGKVPFWLADTYARLLEWQSTLTNTKEPTLTRYGVATLAKSFTLDISKAKQLLKYSPKMNTEESIQEFLNWYKSDEAM